MSGDATAGRLDTNSKFLSSVYPVSRFSGIIEHPFRYPPLTKPHTLATSRDLFRCRLPAAVLTPCDGTTRMWPVLCKTLVASAGALWLNTSRLKETMVCSCPIGVWLSGVSLCTDHVVGSTNGTSSDVRAKSPVRTATEMAGLAG